MDQPAQMLLNIDNFRFLELTKSQLNRNFERTVSATFKIKCFQNIHVKYLFDLSNSRIIHSLQPVGEKIKISFVFRFHKYHFLIYQKIIIH